MIETTPINNDKTVELPEYMKKVHNWAYLNPNYINILDNILVVNLMSFFYAGKLLKLAASEVNENDEVLQMGATYGDQIYKTSDKLEEGGSLDIIDIAKTQVNRWKERLGVYPQTSIYHGDAENQPPTDKKYDVVLSFFLIHELPDAKKTRVIDNMLKCLKDESHTKAVFVDFHKPSKWNPLGSLVRYLTRLYSPFTESLLENDLSSFASSPDDYIWSKETFLGGLYQKTVAMKKL